METVLSTPKVYVESSTISYLTARPSRDLIIKAKQELTRRWWNKRGLYDLYVSEMVLEEIEEGDPEAAELRLRTIEGISTLLLGEEVLRLAKAFLVSNAIPSNSGPDARHIAFAAVYNMDFLITWNQKHIATEKKRKQIEAIISEFNYRPPRLLTPEQHIIFEET